MQHQWCYITWSKWVHSKILANTVWEALPHFHPFHIVDIAITKWLTLAELAHTYCRSLPTPCGQGWHPVLKLWRICGTFLIPDTQHCPGGGGGGEEQDWTELYAELQHSPHCSVLIANIHDMFNLFYTFTNKRLKILQETQHKQHF